jgi:diguanylate cyclase (GGDEF)-like protein/PAS domain S-box-containing protein
MNRPFQQALERLRTGLRHLGLAVPVVIVFVIGITAGTLWTLSRIEVSVRRSAERTLASVLGNAREAAKHWATREQVQVSAIAGDAAVWKSVRIALADQALGTRTPPNQLPAHAVLEPEVRVNGADGYWLFGLDGSTLASWPENLPERPGPSTGDGFTRALDGLSALAYFSGPEGGAPRLLALAPVRDDSGRVIAVLGLGLPARRELGRIAGRTHIRLLARLWFIDESGQVVASSAYDRSGVPAARLQRPGTGELTRSAAAAMVHGAGIDLDGYTDARGNQVIGAWAWDSELGLGIIVESDVRDAYHTVITARSALFTGLAITLLLLAATIILQVAARRKTSDFAALQRRLAAVLQTTTDPVCFTDASGRPIYLNGAGERLLGPGSDSAASLLPEDHLAIAREQGAWAGETTLATIGGTDRTLSQVILCHRGARGEVDFYSTIARDISDRKRLERRLSEEKERAEVTLGSIGDAVIRTDANARVQYANASAEELIGRHHGSLIGRRISDVVSLIHETSRERLENPVDTCLREHRIVSRSNHSLLLRDDGQEYAVDDTTSPVFDLEGKVVGAVLVLHDVSRARSLARQLAHQASHDFLTGLVNRQEFERRVGRLLERARNDGSTHALCFLDLDQFKVVNDTCGHIAGDELLRQLAVTLAGTMRRRDTLSRLGGDEFGILLEHCPPAEAKRLAAACLETVQQTRFVWEGQPFVVGGSIGVVSITAESESLAVILRDADAACYAAKERGRNRVYHYAPDDAVMAIRQGEMQWVSRISSALQENRFQLFGQAIVPLVPRERERSRIEVLIRLVEQDGTLIAPGAFIPAAERYSLMTAVDRWVVRNVIESFAREAPASNRPIFSINLSGMSLGDPSMLSFVREQLEQSGVPPETLCFEVTETSAIANLAQATHFMRELKALGCWFALDDFGSGMSSFGYLQSLPVDALKIAGAFLREIERDPVEYAMVEAINRVGHVMRLKTVAEGVENLETLETLRRLGVDYVQGFAISEPLPLAEIASTHAPLPLTREAERQRLRYHPESRRSRTPIA